MQTNIAAPYRDTPQGQEAEAILRKCVHCGFCLATCPTYTLLGDELDSPRGRIYLMKQMLEGAPVTEKTQLHLDRCLTCRACETTCPSGVEYGRLVDIGRDLVEKQVGRSSAASIERSLLRWALPKRALFSSALAMGRAVKPVLPASLAKMVPSKRAPGEWPAARHARKMLVLDGCVQPVMAPAINRATARVLDALGISLTSVPQATCCGAIAHHLNAQDEALDYVKRNIDAWWPHVESGAEAIVSTASGCGTMLVEYRHLLARDAAYAQKAKRISALVKDVSEIIAGETPGLRAVVKRKPAAPKIAFHPPCSLQHGLKIRGVVENLLRDCGYELTLVKDAHVCCGSAGTYSILQAELSKQLLDSKVASLEAGAPQEVLTANIGCMVHIESGTALRVRHWIEAVDELVR